MRGRLKISALLVSLFLFIGVSSALVPASPASAANGDLQSKITYYTANTGGPFARSTTPFSSGAATQTNNADGSVTVSVDTSGYADSGFVIYDGALSGLTPFSFTGTGDQYGLNLWFDKSGDGEYFAWAPATGNGTMTGLAGDSYILGPGSSAGVLSITDSSNFTSLNPEGGNYTLAQLKNGDAPGIGANTRVAIWVGVTVGNGGSKSATIYSTQNGCAVFSIMKRSNGVWEPWPLTAAFVPGSNQEINTPVDASGCDVGVYVGPSVTGVKVGTTIRDANQVGVLNAGNVTVDASTIRQIGYHDSNHQFAPNGAQTGIGVYFAPESSGSITNSSITAYQKGGIVVKGDVLKGMKASATVTGNTVTGLGQVNFIAQNGIQISSGATALVERNSVSDNYYTPKSWVAVGILILDANGVRVSDNSFSGNERDIYNGGKGGGQYNP